MKFSLCTVQVKNMEESVQFFRDVAGLPVVGRFRGGDTSEIALLGGEHTKIELICNAGQPPAGNGQGISIGFEVENLDDTMNFVHQKGVKIESGPFSPNPQTRFFFVKDPNGVTVQFVENKQIIK